MLATEIALSPAQRPTAAGLLATARSLDGQWWRGVTFAGRGCAEPDRRGPCIGVGTNGDTATGFGDPRVFAPSIVRQSAECAAMSRTDVEEVATNRLDVTREFAAGRVLLTGEATEHGDPDNPDTNPSLQSESTTLSSTALGVVDALACIEQNAAESLFGVTAFIHAPPAVATHLLSQQAMWRDGRLWRTASGNIVVVSPGYEGSAPDGTLADGERWLYATGEVFAATGQRDTISDIDRTENTEIGWSNELVLVAFDPCWVGAVPASVSVC